MEYKQLKTRAQKAFDHKELFRSLYESAYRVAIPSRNLFSSTTVGAKRTEEIYSAVGITAINGFVDTIQATLTPPFVKWAELKAGSLIEEDARDSLNEALEPVTEVLFDTLNGSNFNTSITEMYYDLAVGTGAMLIMEGEVDTIECISVPIAHIALDEGTNGRVDGIHRKHNLKARLIKEQWKDAKIPSELEAIIKESPDNDIELTESTYYDYKAKMWIYCVFSEKFVGKIVERRYEVNPWIIVRWSKVAGEVFGRGPLLNAVPDINSYNKIRELSLRSLQLRAFGVYTVADDGVVNTGTLQIRPGGFIPVERNAGVNGPSIAPLTPSGDINVAQYELEILKQDILKLTLNRNLPDAAGPIRSATEIAERIKEGMVNLGSAYGRLVYELVQSIVKRVLHILSNKGMITLPKEFAKIDNLLTKVQILAPVAKQQNMEDVQSVVQAMGIIGQIDPTLVGLGYKVEDLPEYIGNKLSVPATLIRDKQERETKMQEMAQMAQQQVQQQAQ